MNPGPQDYNQVIPFKKKNEVSIPKSRRDSNNRIVKNDSASPQSYDVISAHSYLNRKNSHSLLKIN